MEPIEFGIYSSVFLLFPSLPLSALIKAEVVCVIVVFLLSRNNILNLKREIKHAHIANLFLLDEVEKKAMRDRIHEFYVKRIALSIFHSTSYCA